VRGGHAVSLIGMTGIGPDLQVWWSWGDSNPWPSHWEKACSAPRGSSTNLGETPADLGRSPPSTSFAATILPSHLGRSRSSSNQYWRIGGDVRPRAMLIREASRIPRCLRRKLLYALDDAVQHWRWYDVAFEAW